MAATIKWIIVDRNIATNKARREIEKIVKAKTTIKSKEETIIKSKGKNTIKSEDKTIVEPEHEKRPPPPNSSHYQEHRSGKRAYATLNEAFSKINTVATMPAVKRLRPRPKSMRKPPNRIEHELWHSRMVQVWASSDVYFWIPSEETRLGIRMGAKLGRKLKARVTDNMDDPKDYTIEFAQNGIRIRYGNDVI